VSLWLDKPLKSVTHGLYNSKRAVTFSAAGHYHPLTGTKLHCLMREARVQITLHM